MLLVDLVVPNIAEESQAIVFGHYIEARFNVEDVGILAEITG